MTCDCLWHLEDGIIRCERVRLHKGLHWQWIDRKLYVWGWPRWQCGNPEGDTAMSEPRAMWRVDSLTMVAPDGERYSGLVPTNLIRLAERLTRTEQQRDDLLVTCQEETDRGDQLQQRLVDVKAERDDLLAALEEAGRQWCVRDAGHAEPCAADVPRLMKGQRVCGLPAPNKYAALIARVKHPEEAAT